MRRGRGGGGQLFFYVPMCWELLFHFTTASEQRSPSPSPLVWSRVFSGRKRVPTLILYIYFFDTRCVFFVSFCISRTRGKRERHSRAVKRATSLKPAADPPEVSRPTHTFSYQEICVCVSERRVIIDFSEVLFNQTPRGDNTSAIQHHDSEVLCHLRHRHRVRSPPDRGDRPGRGSSLPNNDPQPAKKSEYSPSLY